MTKVELSKKKVAKIALRVVRKFIEKERPTAILVTYDLNTAQVETSVLENALVEYLAQELDGVMVAKSCYAIPNNIPLSRILASIDKITNATAIIYAFPFRSWEGTGNPKATEWLEEYVPKTL